MPEPVPNTQTPLSSPASLTPRPDEIDLPCARCGYDLRDLPLSGTCPECNASIARSIEGDLLRFAAPEYRRLLQRGARFLMLGLYCFAAPPSIMLCLLLLLQIVSSVNVTNRLMTTAVGLSSVSMLIGATLVCIGWARFTAPDPDAIGFAHGQVIRRWSRVSAAVLLVAILGLVAFTFGRASRTTVTMLDTWAFVGMIGAILMHLLAAGLMIESIARRIPDSLIAGRGRDAHNLAGASLLFLITGGVMLLLPSPVSRFAFVPIGTAFIGMLLALKDYAGAIELIRRHLAHLPQA